MPLPSLIEIVPLRAPLRAEITVPGSKSITNRALILAALAKGPVTLRGALWSEDTQVMTEALRVLGVDVTVALDRDEFCNRTITVTGLGGRVPRAGTLDKPLELFVGNAGTAARFLAALCCLGDGVYRLHGVPRMHERPQAALFAALRELGYRVDSPNDKLPALVIGGGAAPGVPQPGIGDAVKRVPASPGATRSCTVSIEESSQFASALLLCSRTAGWRVEIVGENAEESPYVAMTQRMLEAFPWSGGEFQIEPDASSGSYFWAAGRLVPQSVEHSDVSGMMVATTQFNLVSVSSWPSSGWQVDEKFNSILGHAAPLHLGLEFERNPLVNDSEERRRCRHPDSTLGPRQMKREHWRRVCEDFGSLVISRRQHLGDSIMTAICLAPFSLEPVRFTDLARLRVQECERVVALRTELTKCGAKILEEGDTLTVYPSELHGATVETYNDHRMAMCFAILGLKVQGIRIQNPACVKKTFPNFFQKLAAPPSHGLGAEIRDGQTGRKLEVQELFAE
jgi:3-phosphoshikimate 1-carboxyvinyltransferase